MDRDTQPLSQEDPAENVDPSFTNDLPMWGVLHWLKAENMEPSKLVSGKDTYTVGRYGSCDILLSQTNCSIKMDNLSRTHCAFKRVLNVVTGHQILLEDCSSNGTFVNGDKIGKGKSKALKHGDEIALTCKLEKVFVFLDPSYKHPDFPHDIASKYIIVKELGKGSFGEVWLAIQKANNKKYAIKSVRRQGRSSESGFSAMEQLKNEAELLCTLKHPCIVQVEDIICRSKSIHLILELMCGGDLQAQIRGKKGTQMCESTAKYFFTQLVLAVQYFHNEGIVHRDLKPENILLSSKTPEEAIVKISDFGLSKLVDDNTLLKTYCGTPLYLAPEVLQARSRETVYTSSCDVWSLGVILFLLLSGTHPFINHKVTTPLDKLISRAEINWKKERWMKVSSEAQALVKEMLQADPKSRPSVLEILAHPWLRDDDVRDKIGRVFAKSGTKSPFRLCSPSVEDEPLAKRRKTEPSPLLVPSPSCITSY